MTDLRAALAAALTIRPDLDVALLLPPMGKQREGGGRVRFTPKETSDWMLCARDQLWHGWHPRAPIGLNEPVMLLVEALVGRDKLPKKAAHAADRFFCTQKPDGDNILKIVADSMIQSSAQRNGTARFVLADDKSVVLWAMAKFYVAEGEREHVRVQLLRLPRTY